MSDQSTPIVTSYPTPAHSARSADLTGTEVVLGDGETWTLADYVPTLSRVWDEIYDQSLLGSHYRREDVQVAALRLLEAHYDLPTEFAVRLIQGADLEALRDAVEWALLGRKDRLRSWSDWAQAALWSNGIDPHLLPADQLRTVLDSLVANGRAVPAVLFTTAGQIAAKRQAMRDMFTAAGIKATPYTPPSEPA